MEDRAQKKRGTFLDIAGNIGSSVAREPAPVISAEWHWPSLPAGRVRDIIDESISTLFDAGLEGSGEHSVAEPSSDPVGLVNKAISTFNLKFQENSCTASSNFAVARALQRNQTAMLNKLGISYNVCDQDDLQLCPGNLGISRKDMPQLSGDQIVEWAKTRPMAPEIKAFSPTPKQFIVNPGDYLLFTQKEINAVSVMGMACEAWKRPNPPFLANNPILLAHVTVAVNGTMQRAYAVMDGHHRAVTQLVVGKPPSFPAYIIDFKLGVGHRQALDIVNAKHTELGNPREFY